MALSIHFEKKNHMCINDVYQIKRCNKILTHSVLFNFFFFLPVKLSRFRTEPVSTSLGFTFFIIETAARKT